MAARRAQKRNTAKDQPLRRALRLVYAAAIEQQSGARSVELKLRIGAPVMGAAAD
jgi:hypothetical protein